MTRREMRRPGNKAGLGLMVAGAITLLAALPPTSASARFQLAHCGKVRSIGVEVLASRVSCKKAIRIVTAYKRGGVGAGLPMEAPGEYRFEASGPSLDRDAQPVADRSCGSVVIQSNSFVVHIARGTPSCTTVRRIARRYGQPISKKPRYFCGHRGYECLYSVYPEGWRCGGLFQGTFQCWRGSNSPNRANAIFDASSGVSRVALELAGHRPACTKRALTRGLHRSGQRGYIDRDGFGCAGRFAFAAVIVDDVEITVLFRATDGRWHSASRARFCEDGTVPKKIYRPACETN
jgi:hypothetical protein